MTPFARQRWTGLALLVAASVLTVWGHRALAGEVPGISHLTGWGLFTLMLVLTGYNARKRFPFLPLLSSEAWLQFHIYAGLFTAVLFAAHVGYRVPGGWFEGILAGLYGLVMLSGLFGLFLTRTLPKRLNARGGEVLHERIPVIRRRLREQAEQLALASIAEAQSTTIADFYTRELKPFFEGAQNLGLHLLEIRSPLNRLLGRINDLNRYLNEAERATLERIAALVRQKDGLDYHHALQWLLKAWLFVHIPLTYSLLLFTVAHIVLVFAFSGGAR